MLLANSYKALGTQARATASVKQVLSRLYNMAKGQGEAAQEAFLEQEEFSLKR